MKTLTSVVSAVSMTSVMAEPLSLFDGKSLTGWEGDPKLWRVEDGMITGGSLTEELPSNVFLATKRNFTNF